MTKICNKCNIEKDLSEFYFRKDNQKYKTVCKRCCCWPINEKKPVNIFKANKIEIIRLYNEERKTLEEIALLFNLKTDSLHYHISKYVKIERHRKYKRIIKENYFEKVNTEEKAYILGLLAADGCNCQESNRILINLQLQDSYMVEKISQALIGMVRVRYTKPYTKIQKRREKEIALNCHGTATFGVTSRKLSLDLSNLGIVSRKSLILKFPNETQVPTYLINHYIRGYVDGDGCISRRFNHGAARWTVTIVSSKGFCENFAMVINNILGLNNLNTKAAQKTKIHKIEFGGNRKIKVFLDWLYKDATIYLERKHKKYQELLNDIKRIDDGPHAFKG